MIFATTIDGLCIHYTQTIHKLLLIVLDYGILPHGDMTSWLRFLCHRTAFLLSSWSGYTLSVYSYMCGLSVMYIERSMEGRKNESDFSK
jgi:hypothetical protein